MDIIRATEEHLPLILPLFDAYRQFYEQPSDLEASSLYLAERLTNQESAIFLAYEQKDGEVRGIGFTQLYVTFSSVALKKFWVLHDLYVREDFRKIGVAKKLMDKSKELALENAPMGLVIESRISNQSAQHLFDSVGFVKQGEHYFYFLED
ncbi:MAG TPA: GNAT family N-acetyltransferase [Cytophagales bacterium]|nr:GNAT family N-acetyltransferase [Cytophagales bacterium]